MPTCCDCKKELPKAGFAKSQLKKKPANRRCLNCAVVTDSVRSGGNGGGGATAAAAAAVRNEQLKIPANAGESTRNVVERGVEVSKSIGGTETASAVEKFVTASGMVGKSSEAVAISQPPAAASPIPPGLADVMPSLTPSQRDLVTALCSPPANQSHLFSSWPASSTNGDKAAKISLIEQLESMDQSYPTGGLLGYISNARALLEKSRKGENPLEGWTPQVPRGEAFEVGTDRWATVEKKGLKYLGKCGFVLVAGGLGERLGYGDIKIGLPTELATGTCYIQYYIETILAYQSRYAEPGTKLPLCIMTSGDTNAKTVALLKANNNFGMDPDQITIVQQGQGVPALSDNDATIALDPDDQHRVLAKPHGHGDIHALLHSYGVAKRWLSELNMQYVVFFQDTNGLAFHCLPLAIGVSDELGLTMNSIAVPRKAKQAIGGISRLVKGKKEERTINVEYNQLDPLLRATGHPDGDVNDPKTGFSPFPGNINQLLFNLDPYVAALERTKGAMPEFVNPKYADAEKTVFKKPTRLECMMQDFPTVLDGADASRVGFTSVSADVCFSPVKNATKDGIALQAKGTHPGVVASGEADQYGAVCKILRAMGCSIEDAAPAIYGGISTIPGPQIVLKSSFVCCPSEYAAKFPDPSEVKISSKSSLVVMGSGVTIESLELDGALVIKCEEGATGVIRNLVVKNRGWVEVPDDSSTDELIKMRGYYLKKTDTRTITFRKDGTIEGDYDPAGTAPATEAPEEKNVEKDLPSLTQPTKEESNEDTGLCGSCIIL